MACERVCWGRAAWCARGRRATWLMVCPWAAARPRAVRAASFARRVVSKPGQALPPPTGPAAWPSVPSTPAALVSLCVAGCVVSKPGQALPPPTGPAAWHRNPLVLSAPSIPAALVSLCVAGRVVSKRARALRALWHPPHRRRLCRCVWLGASPRSPARPRRRPRAPQSTGSTAWPSRSCGALHTGRANPLRVAVRSRFEVVSCPKCRPPRRKTLKTGCYGRSGLRFGRIGTCHSALLAREPAIASGNPLCRT